MASSLRLSTLIDRVCFALRGDYGTSETTLRAEVKRTLNDVQNEIWRDHVLSDFAAEVEFTTVTDQQDYDLPDDVGRVLEPSLRFSGTDGREVVSYVTAQEWDRETQTRQTDESGKPCWYTVLGNASYDGSSGSGSRILRLYPPPDDTYDLIYRYIARPFQIGEASETSFLDPRFREEFADLFITGATMRFPQFLNADQMAIMEERYRRGVWALRAHAHAVVGASHEKRTGFVSIGSVGLYSSDTGLTGSGEV